MRAVVGIAVVAMLLAGCSSSSRPGRSSTPPPTRTSPASATSSAPANPKLDARCPDESDGITSVPFDFHAADGTKLFGVELGHGPRGVVMVHELGGSGLCGWLPYGKYLADHGMHVLLYDTRCTGSSGCNIATQDDIVSDVAGAKTLLGTRGARTVAVVGASFGGAIALAAAAAVKGLRACVDLSGDLYEQDLGGLTGRQAAKRLAIPLLYAVATLDGDRLQTARGIVKLVTPSLVRLQVLDGGEHGWDMLQDTSSGKFTPLAAQVAAFLTAHLR